MSSLTPQRKVAVGFAAGAIVTVLAGIGRRYGFELTADETSALVVIITFVASYMVPNAQQQEFAE